MAAGAYFGKLPFAGDFLRHGSAPELEAIDLWVREGLVGARVGQRDGHDWDGRQPSSFLSSTQAGAFVGVFAPSNDSVGRRYPFTVGARMTGGVATASIGMRGFEAEAVRLVSEAQNGAPRDASVDELRRLALPDDDSVGHAELAAYRSERPAVDLFPERLAAASEERRALYLFDIWAPMVSSPPVKFVVRWPVRSDVDVAFWLTAALQCAAEASGPRLAMWPSGIRDGCGTLRVLFGDLAGRYFVPMVWPERSHDNAFDPATDYVAPARRRADAIERFGDVVRSAGTAGDLLAAFTRT